MTDTTTSAATGAGTDEAAGLARRLLFLQEQEKAIAEEKQSIGRRLAKLQDTQKKHDYAGVTVEVHAGRRTLDAKRFEQKYPLSEATAAYYTPRPQSLSKLQRLVPGGVPDDCTKTGQPWVTASRTEAGNE